MEEKPYQPSLFYGERWPLLRFETCDDLGIVHFRDTPKWWDSNPSTFTNQPLFDLMGNIGISISGWWFHPPKNLLVIGGHHPKDIPNRVEHEKSWPCGKPNTNNKPCPKSQFWWVVIQPSPNNDCLWHWISHIALYCSLLTERIPKGQDLTTPCSVQKWAMEIIKHGRKI